MAKLNLDNFSISNSNELIDFWKNNEYKKPSVIVFDLDFTLWPYFANRYYQIPFKIHKDSLNDSNNKKVTYFKDVPNILKTLKEECFKNGEKLAIASRSGDRKTVENLLDALGWTQYFSSIQIYPGNKNRHITNISNELGIKESNQILFFDDDPENIYNTINLGIIGCLINKNIGLDFNTLISGLQKYSLKVCKNQNKS